MKPTLTNKLLSQEFVVDQVEDLGYVKRITTTLEGRPFIIIANNEEYATQWQ
jgi:hypothetical protein